MAPGGVILWEGQILNGAGRAGFFENQIRQFLDGELTRVTKVDWSGDFWATRHHGQQTFNEIVDITERARLLALTVDGEWSSIQCTDNEIGNNATVMWMHAGAVGIEKSNNLDIKVVLPAVIKEQGFGSPLTFVVAGPRTNRVHIAPVVLRLGVHLRVTINLGS